MANGNDLVHASPEHLPVAVGAALQSNMPNHHKTHIREWYERTMMRGKGIVTAAPVLTVAQEAGSVALGDLVGAITGGFLGWVESRNGKLDFGKRNDLPADAGLAGLSAIAAIAAAGHPSGASAIARYVSIASSAIYSQRKSKEHFDAAKGVATVHGEGSNKDKSPLLEYAENL